MQDDDDDVEFGIYKIVITYRKPSNYDSWMSRDCTEYLASDYRLQEDRIYIQTKTATVIEMINSDIQTIEMSKKVDSDE